MKSDQTSNDVVPAAAVFPRIFTYCALVLLSYCVLLAELRFTADPADYFLEFGIAEMWQFVLLFVACALLIVAIAKVTEDRELNILVVGLLTCMFVREADAFFDVFVFDGAWQVVVTLVLIATGWILRKSFRAIGPQLNRLAHSSPFGFAVAAFVSLVLFSRLFGRGTFWKQLMQDDYVRVAKNAAEEGTEILGYTLLLIGVIDHLWRYRRLAALRSG